MVDKISYSEYLEMIRSPDLDDEELLKYSVIEKGSGGFEFTLKPDPQKVELTPEDVEFESAMKIGNGVARYRRRIKFNRRKKEHPALPVLVSEGDSWFQFPFLIKDVIDHLSAHYHIWSVGAAGDTAENMVFKNERPRQTEFMIALDKHRDEVKGFLFSAAGNDIIGEDPDTDIPVLLDLLKHFNNDTSDIEGHIDLNLLKEKLDFLEDAYRTVIQRIRSKPHFKTLPIFIHGYDYAFPYPWPADEHRDPIYAEKDEWLGSAFKQREIMDPQHRREIIKYMIERLYTMLTSVAGNSQQTGVWLIDCRGALPDVSDWKDEIHGTSDGFTEVAARFKAVIDPAIA